MKTRSPRTLKQPQPCIPGLTRQMVKAHAMKLFRDVFPGQSLTELEWWLVEQDLARKIENDGF